MAELLVRVADKVNDDFYLNAKCTKRGDVIVIMPDKWTWGTDEVASAEWQIIKIPGVKPDDLSGYLAPELNADPQNPSKTLQRRAFKFNLDKLVVDLRLDPKAVTSAKTEAIIAPLDTTTALTYQVAKPAIADINKL